MGGTLLVHLHQIPRGTLGKTSRERDQASEKSTDMRGRRWEEKGRDEGVHILVAVLITLVEDLGGAEKACTDPAIDTKTEQGRDNGDPRNIGMTVAMDACPTACWHT